MANEQNLKPKPFKKGQSGNPNGRPKGSRNRSTILKEILETLSDFQNPLSKSKEKMEVEKAIDLAIIGKALKGDVNAYKEIKDTVYGKNTDKSEAEVVMRILDESE